MADVKLWRYIQTSALINELVHETRLAYERTDPPKTNKYIEVTRAVIDFERKKQEMARTDSTQEINVRVEYNTIPPQVFISQLNRFIHENQPPNFSVQIKWEDVRDSPGQDEEGMIQLHPRGYRQSSTYPVLRAENHCRHCLCAPCVVAFPPDFLRGSCSPHPANAEKRYILYRKFWGLLKDLGVWRDEEYLLRKQQRTVRDDRRDIMPNCVIEEIRKRYPSHDGRYRDYLSTFDAEALEL